MIVDLSQSLHFRDFATVSRMFFEVFGVLLGESIEFIPICSFILLMLLPVYVVAPNALTMSKGERV